MDADLQHPPSLVPDWWRPASATAPDLVVASRYIEGGSRAGLAGGYRMAVSRGATWLTKVLFPRRAARHQRPDERLLRDPPQRGHRRRPAAARLQDPARAGRAQPARAGRRGAVRLPGPATPASPSRPRRRAPLPARTSSGCAPPRRSPGWSVFGLIGVTGFAAEPARAVAAHRAPACTTCRPRSLANQLGGRPGTSLLIDTCCFRDRRGTAAWADRVGPVRAAGQRRPAAADPADRAARRRRRDGRAGRHRGRAGDDVRPALRRRPRPGLSAATEAGGAPRRLQPHGKESRVRHPPDRFSRRSARTRDGPHCWPSSA